MAHLIKSCRDLKDRGYDFICQIVGQGPQRKELESLIAQLSLEDRVVLCGALPHEEVIEKYRQSTMFVLPCVESRTGNLDGIPNVLAEAMAISRPLAQKMAYCLRKVRVIERIGKRGRANSYRVGGA